MAEERKRVGKADGITAAQLGDWHNYTMQNYTGVGEKDPITAAYKTLSPEAIAQYVDPYKLGFDVAKELDPTKYSSKYDEIKGKWIVTTKESGEILTDAEVQRAVKGRISTNKEYLNYLSQSAKFKGQEYNEDYLNTAINPIVNSLGEAFSVFNTEDEMGIKGNPYELVNARARAQKKIIKDLMGPRNMEVRTSPGMPINAAFGKARLPDPSKPKGDDVVTDPRAGIMTVPRRKTEFNDIYQTFDNYYQEGLRNVPPALTDAYNKLYEEVKEKNTKNFQWYKNEPGKAEFYTEEVDAGGNTTKTYHGLKRGKPTLGTIDEDIIMDVSAAKEFHKR